MDGLTHVHGQDHSEEPSAEERPRLHSAGDETRRLLKHCGKHTLDRATVNILYTIPIFPCFVFKHLVAILNPLFGQGVDS